jgi:cytochrome c553
MEPIRDTRSLLCGLLVLALGAGAAAAAAASPESGARLYRDCAACHGADGGGVADGSVPAIGGQPAAVIVSALRDFRAARRTDLRMQHFSDPQHLATDADIAAVAAHVAGLQRTTPAGTGDAAMTAQGAVLYARRCAACHGAEASASTLPPRPALAGQHAAYVARKMRDGGMIDEQARRHASLTKQIGADGIAAIADWLSRLPPPP